MKIHQLTVAEAFESVQSGPEGLSTKEAARRLEEYGPNTVERVLGEALLWRFLKGFSHFFAVIFWIAAGMAFLSDLRDPGQGMFTLGGAILGVILVNGTFSFWQEYRAERALNALRQLLPQQVRLKREGQFVPGAASSLVPGDVILLKGGDRVPADCRVVETFGLRVDNATITGESLPHSRDATVSEDPDFQHSHNVLLAGTSVVSGEAAALIFATGVHTVFGQIAHLSQAARDPLSPLQLELVQLSRWVALLASALGVLFFIVGRSVGLPFWSNMTFAIGVIVANVPEGLMPTLTLALAMGSQRMAKRNALVRHLSAVEALGAATVICTDKTGTLTENRLTARRLWLGGRTLEAKAQSPQRNTTRSHRSFFEIARNAHSLQRTGAGEHQSWFGDPLDVALVELAEEIDPGQVELTRLDEIPFDSKRCRMSTLHQRPDGQVLFTKGAPEMVLPLCSHVDSEAGPLPLDQGWRSRVTQAHNDMAQHGMRVLALAYREIGMERSKVPKTKGWSAWEHDLVLSGLIGFEDPPRAEVPDAIARCREAGIKVVMVTGDHPNTARAVACRIGLTQTDKAPRMITGAQLEKLSNTQLQLALDASDILFARVAAHQKLRIVAAFKRKGEIVAVTGDGVNDAPALKHADIGIAMGRGGTDVARESSDIILLDDNFATIVAAIEEGRAVYANIRKFLTYILTSNVPELIPYLASALFRIPLPLTIIQILAVDLGTDMLPALALGAEPPDTLTMRRPPRSRSERLLNMTLIVRAYLWLGLMQAAAAMTVFFLVLNSNGWRYGDLLSSQNPIYLQATTACLSAIIVMQMVNVFLCRSRRQSIWHFGLGTNPLILAGVGVEVALLHLLVYTPWGNAVFGTAPLPLSVWLWMIPFALASIGLEEGRKWVQRAREG